VDSATNKEKPPAQHSQRGNCADWINDGEGGYCGETQEEADRKYLDLISGGSTGCSIGGSGGGGSAGSGSNQSSGTGGPDQPSVYNGRYRDCDDFGSRAEAQAHLEANPADADYLDGDGDGVACEWSTRE
jgi:hypothetical protein